MNQPNLSCPLRGLLSPTPHPWAARDLPRPPVPSATETEPGIRPLLWSLAGASEQLSIGQTLLHGLVTSGQLRSVKVGGRRLIRDDDLVAFVQQLQED